MKFSFTTIFLFFFFFFFFLSLLPFTHSHPPTTYPPVHNAKIFSAPSNYTLPRVLYARAVLHPDQQRTLLATWENYSPQLPLVYAPIYRLVDGGATWHAYSTITDQVNGWGLRYQPFLYVLPERIGKLEKGSLLYAGNSIPEDRSQTKIDVYASTDGGRSWAFVSSVARGGEAEPDNG